MLKEAVNWVKRNAIDGCCVPITHRNRKPYPEVTGYWIPTLLEIGEWELATSFARYLVSIQSPDGSFTLEGTNENFVFDTGQIIRGWVAIAKILPEVEVPLRRACEWIVTGADPDTGKFSIPPPGNMWSLGHRGEVNEGIHLYVIQPLRDASVILNAPHIKAAADRALACYLTTLDLTNFEKPNALTHFYAYIQEALVEIGERDRAIQGMNSVARYQLRNGSVPAFHDVNWICSTGLIQLAKVWYMLGDKARADAALTFARSLQNFSGGFYGSYGPGATYFPSDEISWAQKYAIDVELLARENYFETSPSTYSATIPSNDSRAEAVLALCHTANKVLDAGCGNGRYAALIKSKFPKIEIHATDISPARLAKVPAGIMTQYGDIQNMPFEEETFDAVYCIEALEHAPDPRRAIAELARVVRPGGQLLIIDKNIDKVGTLDMAGWENWFSRDFVQTVLSELGMSCNARDLGKTDSHEGLFIAWSATKRDNPTDLKKFSQSDGDRERSL